jgi:TRAP transporter 4TM/12TM fusion protein
LRNTLPVKQITGIIAVAFALFYFYTSGFGIFSTQSNLAFYIFFTDILCILSYPAFKKKPNSRILAVLDIIIIILITISVLYWLIEFPVYAAKRSGMANTTDMVMAAILIVLSLEVTRRAMGNALLILGLVMLVQTYFGPYLPGIFTHKGISLRQLLSFTYFTDGIFGTVASTFAVYVMPFLIFGAFLQHSGGGDFFIDLATAIAGKVAGGPALVAVGGSAIFGSISGSPIANVVATGNFTIPLMKRVGYTPEFAGAVEATASTGGAFLPPVMGAGAFILATNTNTPYGQVATMALVPALLYYFSLTSMVYFRARRRGLLGLPASELPNKWIILKQGWYYIFVILLIILALVGGYSVPKTAFFGCVFLLVCSMFRKETRFTFRKFLDTMKDAAKSSLIVGATAGTLGVIMAGITLTGLGVKFSSIILSLSQGNLFFTLVLVAIIAMIIGMGLTITASYIVLAILAAPSLISLGVPPVVAHMACFWLSMTSNLTPPVCIAAFTAAGISGGKPMRTGLHSCVLGIFLYVMPFAMVYCPQLLVLGSSLSAVLEMILSYVLLTVALSAAIQGWFFRDLGVASRILCLIACVFLGMPDIYSDLVGMMLLGGLGIFHYIRARHSTMR